PRGRHPGAAQDQPVVRVPRGRLIRDPGAVQTAVEPVAALVAREDTTRPVAAVRRRCQADDQHARSRITEARNRPPPVAPAAETRDALSRHPLAMRDEPRAATAADEAGPQARPAPPPPTQH